MNDLREIIGSTMKQLSSEKDIVSSAKIRAAAGHSESKVSAKRILCTGAAVCGILICGVTVAAATGLIDFEAVFGDRFAVEVGQTADNMLGMVKDFEYRVSDDDYKIEITAITGDDKSMVGYAEISRVDGTPVTEHFINPTDELSLTALWGHPGVMQPEGTGYAGYGCAVNERGNIDFAFEVNCDRSLAGKTFSYESKNFYPSETYDEFLSENKAFYMEWEDFSGYVAEGSKYIDYTPVEIDDSGVAALELEWGFSFVYKPSEAALKTKVCPDTAEDFLLYQYSAGSVLQEDGSRYSDPDSRVDLETVADCTYIEVGPMSGRIKFRYELTEYHQQKFIDDRSVTDDMDKNVFFLITSDGGTIPVEFGAGTGTGDGKEVIFECDYELVYPDENDKMRIIDTEKVTAISMNGTVYELD